MEKIICDKCKKEIEENSIICGYCGTAVPKEKLSNETLNNLKENERNDESLQRDTRTNVKALGVVLLVVGGIFDFISLCMIGSSSFESFHIITIIGTAAFGIGFFLTFLG